MNASNIIYKSDVLYGVKGYYVDPTVFLKTYAKLDNVERKSMVYHYIMDNSPFAFTKIYEKPLLFEQIRQYISYILDVNINHIKLIGSTKTGFKMDSHNYGADYKKESDLDFMIIDDSLYNKLSQEFIIWKQAYHDGSMKPHTDKEMAYWDENIINLRRNIGLGFIDTNKMPNRQDLLPVNSKVNNTMSMVIRKLQSEHGFSTNRASMRVYKDIDSYFTQQNRNINSILRAMGYWGI